jgi:hypothetical protein
MSEKDSQKSAFENINLILAICAIAISAASFYATYIQAEAAEKQVKAATWPFLLFGSGNFNDDNELEVSLNILNGGVGPAHIKQFQLHYKDKTYTNIYSWLEDCCAKGAPFIKRLADSPIEDTAGIPLTGSVANSLISANQENKFFRMVATDENRILWDEINTERHKLTASACYCSLLDNCYETNFKSDPVEVDSCSEQ